MMEIMLACFAAAIGYAIGRSDREDFRQDPKDLDSFTVVRLHRQAARKAAPRRRG